MPDRSPAASRRGFRGSVQRFAGPEEASLALLSQAVTVALDGDDVTVVQQAVQDCRGQHGVAEHLAPVAHGLVAGEDQAAPLVAAVHQLEQQVRRPAFKGQIAQFVASVPKIPGDGIMRGFGRRIRPVFNRRQPWIGY